MCSPWFRRTLYSLRRRELKISWLLLFLLVGCRAWRSDSVSVPTVFFDGNPIALDRWAAIGPFEASEGTDCWQFGFLGERDEPRGGLDARVFNADCKKMSANVDGGQRPCALDLKDAIFADFQNLFHFPHVGTEPARAVYLACTLRCARPSKGFLMVGSADEEKVWLNEDLVGGAPTRRSVATYDDAFPVDFHAGDNFLLIKVVRVANTAWGFTARLESSAQSAAASALAGQGMLQGLLLSRSVLPVGAPLELSPRGVPVGTSFEAQIVDESGTTIDRPLLKAGIGRWLSATDVPPGLYEIRLNLNGVVYREGFYIGEPDIMARRLVESAGRYRDDARVADDLAILQTRLDILLLPSNRQFASAGLRRDWERKMVYTLQECDHALRAIEAGQDAFRNVPGLHFGAFRSGIDGQLECYRLFVPSSYDPAGPGLPLVIMLPTVTSASRPFIASAFVAAHSEAERTAVIAERHHVGILWSGFRNQPTGQPCEFVHLDEVLNAVGKDYRIDPSRITLLGSCSGGAMATMTAARWPGRFAGIGLLNPNFSLDKGTSDELSELFEGSPGFRAWVEHNDDVEPFLKLRGTPVYLIHDGAEPGHGDLKVSMEFSRMAGAAGFPLRFEQHIQTLGQHFGAWEYLIAWLADQRRDNPNSKWDTAVAPEPGRGGPAANVLAGRFVVVEGTEGTPSDRENTARIGDEFQDAWRKTHYGACRIATDRDLPAGEESASNLVLIGNPTTNVVWRRLAPHLPVSLRGDSLRVMNHSWTGHNLTIEAVFRNPSQPGRWLILLGSQDLASARFGTVNLSVEGWFDYAVWDAEGVGLKQVEAGRW